MREIFEKILALPRRIEPIGGQNYSYLCLEDVTGLIESELAKPDPEPVCFAKWEPIETAPKDGTERLYGLLVDEGEPA